MKQLADTCEEARAVQIAVLQRMGPSGRARLVAELSHRARDLVEEGVRLRHPDWPSGRVRRQAIRQMIGSRLYREVYGERDPDDR